MKGIFGWSGNSETAADIIHSALQRGTSTGQKLTYAAMLTAPPDARWQQHQPCSGNGVTAAIVGRVIWREPEVATIAKAHGDHAALAHAYQRSPADFLRHIGGHFSLAILDSRADLALLAVDRIGAYPMCYSLTQAGQLVFGSDAILVKSHPAVSAALSPQGLYDFVYFHMIPSPGTVYRDIQKLEPAQLLSFKKGKIERRRYWEPKFNDHGGGDFSALQDEFMNILRGSVARCNPDDTTGAFLSGGTDSSTVSGILSGLRPGKAKTYSIGFSQEGYDEISYARIASKQFNTQQHEYYVTPQDVAEAFPKVAQAYDEPFGNSSAIPTYFCAQLAHRDGTRTMLAGDGGDELFGGNSRYAKQKVFDFYQQIPPGVRSAIVEPLFLGLPGTQWFPPARKVRSYIQQARMPMPDRMESYNFLQRSDPRDMFAPDYFARCNTQHPLQLLNTTWKQAPTDSLLNQMLYLDWKITLADNDLRKVNRMCERAGIEVLYPMLDDELLEFSARVPPEMKLKGQKLRYFFKKSLENFLPHEIIHKKKHGFGLPFGEWLKASPELQDVIYSNLSGLKARGLIREQFIDNLISTHKDGHAAYYGTLIWVLAMLEQWFVQHKVSP